MRAWGGVWVVVLLCSFAMRLDAAPQSASASAATERTIASAGNELPVDGDVTSTPRTLQESLDAVALLPWLDPQGPAWAPRRGTRTEVCVMVGGEGALGAVTADALPIVGGTVLTALVRYYPVDRLAVIVGLRSFAGLDGALAPGTTASSVSSIVSGARYDLVRENRFSLMWDLYSGPSVFALSDVEQLGRNGSRFALGGEMGTGLSARYSIGPWTGELRGALGGRAGAGPAGFSGDGPFSSMYAAVDLGVTWSIQ